MSTAEAEFVDRIGLFMETVGGPRTMGRIYGWLMICDPAHRSLTELATELGVSKASVSTVIRPMQEGGLVERLPSSARQHHYRVAPGGFTQIMQVQLARMRNGIEAAEFGLSVLGADRRQQRERLADFRDFCEFTASDIGGEFMRRWAEYRAAKRSEQ
ncbi:GbsR/MarR family transcriptional regulator [Saccharopolyspora phatthalungensis]|uniref:DNA-binding transcriptional regulator GbsR (MarR family) n=1 Tax=Saccharopolyspora phatthalungensis TaxID=664693 RepID=A0A840QB35_9PSEU|nr:MarR family transcriptional regulator [Saccharopolyspora phatthalungensis]MBB5157974.1 DNA-binding transcriptional regulator GbsR (MarR family) [Saccharopolyspora phatthalungensis]